MKDFCIFFLCFRFFILLFWIYTPFLGEYIHAYIQEYIQEKTLNFWHFCFPTATLTPSVMSTESLPIKGLPLVCTILSSSPRMAPAHRFWKYGYILPQKNSLTKISAYLGSLLHCPIGTSQPTRCPLILATAQGEPPFLRSLSATS